MCTGTNMQPSLSFTMSTNAVLWTVGAVAAGAVVSPEHIKAMQDSSRGLQACQGLV